VHLDWNIVAALFLSLFIATLFRAWIIESHRNYFGTLVLIEVMDFE